MKIFRQLQFFKDFLKTPWNVLRQFLNYRLTRWLMASISVPFGLTVPVLVRSLNIAAALWILFCFTKKKIFFLSFSFSCPSLKYAQHWTIYVAIHRYTAEPLHLAANWEPSADFFAGILRFLRFLMTTFFFFVIWFDFFIAAHKCSLWVYGCVRDTAVRERWSTCSTDVSPWR